MSVVVAKLRHSFMGIFIRSKMIVNKKRPPWQEVVFNVTNNLGKLSPQGGDLVQSGKKSFRDEALKDSRSLSLRKQWISSAPKSAPETHFPV